MCKNLGLPCWHKVKQHEQGEVLGLIELPRTCAKEAMDVLHKAVAATEAASPETRPVAAAA